MTSIKADNKATTAQLERDDPDLANFLRDYRLPPSFATTEQPTQSQEPYGTWSHYGGLSPLKQRHYETDPAEKSYHNPPCRRGIYAFPKGYEEIFMISATSKIGHISNKTFRLKDASGENLKWDDHILKRENGTLLYISQKAKSLLRQRGIKPNQAYKDSSDNIAVLRKPRHFNHTGDLWHHLIDQVDPKDLLDQKGSWIKTTFKVWQEAFKVRSHQDMRYLHGEIGFEDLKKSTIGPKIDPYKKTGGGFSTDHLEVFIERPK